MLLSTGAMVAQYVRQKVNLAFNNQVHYLNNFLLFTLKKLNNWVEQCFILKGMIHRKYIERMLFPNVDGFVDQTN